MAISLGTPGASQEDSNTLNHDIVLPASYSNGQMLFMAIACDGAPTITVPTFWNTLDKEDNGTVHCSGIYWGVANGNEDNDLVWEASAVEQSVTRVWPVIDCNTSQTPEINATAGEGSSLNPNPPSVTPSWGTASDTMAVIIMTNDSNVTVSTFPTDYTANGVNHGTGGTGAARLASSYRVLNTAAAIDPGTATLSGTEQWNAFTILFRQAAPLPPKRHQPIIVPRYAVRRSSSW